MLPSFLIILIVARCYQAFQKSKTVQGIMGGLKSAVVGLIASAVLTVGATVFTPASAASNLLWAAVVAGLFALSLRFKKLHPIVIICISAVVGIAAGCLGV